VLKHNAIRCREGVAEKLHTFFTLEVIPIAEVVWCTQKPVIRTWWWRKNPSYPAGNRTPVVQPVAKYFIK
jgi:hypothetical protein